MKRGSIPHGYTILETLIVIAVTGLLFASAVGMFRGRQIHNQFVQATDQFRAAMQDVSNDVINGQFAKNNSYTCSVSAGSVTITSGSGSQGTNTDCIFLGKVVQFGVQDGTNCDAAPSDQGACDLFKTYVIAGQRKKNDGKEVTSLTEAKPQSIDVLTNEGSLDYGLHISAVWNLGDSSNAATKIGGVAFVAPLNSYQNDSLQTGVQQVSFYPINTTSLGQTGGEFGSVISAANGANYGTPDPQNGILICLSRSDDKEKSAILIGGDNKQAVASTLFGDEYVSKTQGKCPA